MEYNKDLAEGLGADEYGMKSYFFVLIRTGDTVVTDETEKTRLFKGHIDNIIHLEDMGKIVVAGPFGKNDDEMRGIFIMDADSEDEVRRLLADDPTIEQGIFRIDIYPWYGSAALPTYLDVHAKIAKNNPA